MRSLSAPLTWIKKISLLLLVALMPLFMGMLSPQTLNAAETLSVKFFCPRVANSTGSSGNSYRVAVWLTDGATYVGSLGYYWGAGKNNYLDQWTFDNDATSPIRKPNGTTDARIGATQSFTSSELTARGRTFNFPTADVSSLPNNTYTIHFETVREDDHYRKATATWIKNGTSLTNQALTLTQVFRLSKPSNDTTNIFKDATFTYDVGTPTNTMAINGGDSQSATVNTAVGTDPSVIVRDSSNNPVPNIPVTFSVFSGGGSVVGGSATTNTSGIATITSWTLGTTAGSNQLRASSSGLTTLTFTATGTAGTATQIAVNAGNNQSATVNTTVGTTPSVIVKDVHGNPKAGVAVTFAVASGGGSITGTNPAITNTSGVAAIGTWKLGTATGTNTLTASATGLTGSPITFTATGTAGAATQIAISAGNSQSATVSTALAVDPAVLISDAFNNPVSGASVTFAVASGGGSVTGSPATSGTNGIATITAWTLGATAGANTLTATKTGLTGSPITFTATGVAASTNTLAINAGNTQSATVNTAVGTDPSVIVRDNSNNPVSGIPITFSVFSGGGSVVGGSATTNASGIATVTSWTLGTTAGSNQLRASGAGLTTVTFTATGSAGAATTMAISAGNNQSKSIGTAVTVKPAVLITDAFGNAVTGTTVNFAVGSGGGSVTTPNPTSNASGIATVGNWILGSTLGTNQLIATATGLTGSPLTFTATATAGAATTVAISAGDGETADVDTNIGISPAVLVTDASGNPVSGVTVVFAIASGGGTVTDANQITDVNGVATVGEWTLGGTAGTNQLTATVTGLTPVTFTATANAVTTPPPSSTPTTSEPKKCGYGAGLSTFLLMILASLSLMITNRRGTKRD